MMRLTHNIPKFLAVLFVIALVFFIAQIVSRGNITFSKQPVTPTVAPETGFVLDIPQKALMKNYVVVSAQTTSGTTCELLYVPPSGEVQKMDTVATDNGFCTWKWKIEESQGKGNGRLIFTINGVSETHFIEIRSSF